MGQKLLDFADNQDLDPDAIISRRNFTIAILSMVKAAHRGLFENTQAIADLKLNELKTALAEVCTLQVLLF